MTSVLSFVAGSVAVSLIISAAFILIHTRVLVMDGLKDQASVITSIVEVEFSVFFDKEDNSGWNDPMERSLQQIMASSDNLLEINIYEIPTGRAAASSDISLKGKAVDPEDIEAARNDETVVLFEKEDGISFIDVTSPLHTNGNIDYVMGIKISTAQELGELRATVFQTLGIGVFFLAIVIVIILVFSRRLIKPILSVGEGVKDLAVGDSDLKKRLHVRRQDEIGRLASDFNTFSGQLQDSFRNIKDSQAEITELVQRLEKSSAATTNAVLTVKSSIDCVRTSASEQTDSARNSAATVEEIARSIESLNKTIGDQAEHVSQASGAIEQMTANIASVSSAVEKMSDQFADLALAAKEGKGEQESSALLI